METHQRVLYSKQNSRADVLPRMGKYYDLLSISKQQANVGADDKFYFAAKHENKWAGDFVVLLLSSLFP